MHCGPCGPKKTAEIQAAIAPCGIRRASCAVFASPSSPCARDVTDTFTTAGVTRAATASTALSSATNEDTLLSSIGAPRPNRRRMSHVWLNNKNSLRKNARNRAGRSCELASPLLLMN